MTTRTRASRRRWSVLGVLAVTLGGCSGSGSSGTTASSSIADTAPRGSVVWSAPTTVAPASTVTSPPQPIDPSTTVTAPPSPTGVPGIDASDAFCAAWARYGGTVQILAVAVNFGELDALSVARLELQSAPTIVVSVAEIEAAWPAEIAAERDAAIQRYLGPYSRRAEKALAALSDAGIDTAGQAQLAEAWAQVLAAHDPDQPTVTVDLPADLAARVDAGAAAFDAAVTPWAEDPSLTANLDDIPQTKAYLATHCPDLASIGIGDDV